MVVLGCNNGGGGGNFLKEEKFGFQLRSKELDSGGRAP